MGSFSYTSRPAFIFIQGVSLTHPLLACFFFCFFFKSGEFLLHIPCWFNFLLREFLLHIRCWLRFFMRGVSLIHPVLPSFLSVEFVTRCVLAFFFFFFFNYLGSFSYTSRAFFFFFFFFFKYLGGFSYTSHVGFIFLWGVSLTHPVLASFFKFIFIWGVCLTHPMLDSVFCGEFLLHVHC